jgi:hypothetical protein
MGEMASLVRGTTGVFRGWSDQCLLVSPSLAARPAIGTINGNTIKDRRLTAHRRGTAAVLTMDFPGFMPDRVIAGFHFQCRPFFHGCRPSVA